MLHCATLGVDAITPSGYNYAVVGDYLVRADYDETLDWNYYARRCKFPKKPSPTGG